MNRKRLNKGDEQNASNYTRIDKTKWQAGGIGKTRRNNKRAKPLAQFQARSRTATKAWKDTIRC